MFWPINVAIKYTIAAIWAMKSIVVSSVQFRDSRMIPMHLRLSYTTITFLCRLVLSTLLFLSLSHTHLPPFLHYLTTTLQYSSHSTVTAYFEVIKYYHLWFGFGYVETDAWTKWENKRGERERERFTGAELKTENLMTVYCFSRATTRQKFLSKKKDPQTP